MTFFTQTQKNRLTTRNICLIALFSALTSAGAYISIPMIPVPATFQTFFVVISGMLLGAQNGALSQIIYLLVGILGVPVFANFSGGLGVVFGPTGGYLLGFIAASYLIGTLNASFKPKGILNYFLIMFTGMLLIYILGVIQLMLVTGMNFVKSIILGVLPFIPGDILKVITAAFVYDKINRIKTG